MNSMKISRAALVLAVTGLVAAGCGSSSGSSSGTTTAAGTTAPVASTAPAATSAAGSAAPGTTGGATESSVDTSQNKASDQGVTPTSIKLGFVNAKTGVAASSFGPQAYAAAKARFEVENAKGGIFGRKLDLLDGDDQSIPANNLQLLKKFNEQDKVFGLVVVSPMFFAGYRYTVDKGIPVTSAAIDGAPYGPPNNNLFSAIGNADPKYKAGPAKGQYFKSKGATNVGVIAYGDSPSSTGSAKQAGKSVEIAGLKTTYQVNIPFGSTDFTATALQFKQAGVDAVITSMVLSSNVAAIKALQDAGVQLKASMVFGGYNEAVLEDSTAKSTLQGIGLTTGMKPMSLDDPATKAMRDALKQYAGYDKSDPLQGQIFGWNAADLMVRGLQEAGQNPTRKAFIDDLLKVKNYDMGGLLGATVDFSKQAWIEQATNANCMWIAVLEGDKFTTDPSDGKPICQDALIPGTEQA
jgi:branched-chain amino acid transport system substrate-binding protein